jgi:hypothetical protein
VLHDLFRPAQFFRSSAQSRAFFLNRAPTYAFFASAALMTDDNLWILCESIICWNAGEAWPRRRNVPLEPCVYAELQAPTSGLSYQGNHKQIQTDAMEKVFEPLDADADD